MAPAVEVQSPTHWTTREFPGSYSLVQFLLSFFLPSFYVFVFPSLFSFRNIIELFLVSDIMMVLELDM